MDTNDKKDGQKPEVYKIVTLGQGNLSRREFVKSVVVATGAAAVAMSTGESDAAQAKNRAGPAVNLLLQDDTADPCSSIGCQCHMVCACDPVGACGCDVVSSRCKPVLTGRQENTKTFNQVQEFNVSVCTCDRVAVCSCNTVCTCQDVCPCVSHCTCQSDCSSHGGGVIYYWYPN